MAPAADDWIFSGSEVDEEEEAAQPGRWGVARSNTIGSLTEYVLDKDRHEKKGLRRDVDFVRQLARSVSAATPAAELDAVKFNPSDRLTAWFAGMGPLLTSLTEMQLDKGPPDSSFASSRVSLRAARTSSKPPPGLPPTAPSSLDPKARAFACQHASCDSLDGSSRSLRHTLHACRSVSSVDSRPSYRSSFVSLSSFVKPPVKVRATLGIGVRHASGRLGATRTPALVSACVETLVHESIRSLDGGGSEDVAKAIAPFASREPSWWDSLQLWLVTTKEEREYLHAAAAEDRREDRESQLRQSTEALRRSQARTIATSLGSASYRNSRFSSRPSSAMASSSSLTQTSATPSRGVSCSSSSRACTRPQTAGGAGTSTGARSSTTQPAPLPPPAEIAVSTRISHRHEPSRCSASAAGEAASRHSRSSRPAASPNSSTRASAQGVSSGGALRGSRQCERRASSQSSIGSERDIDESTVVSV
jgi:hypothetical protein